MRRTPLKRFIRLFLLPACLLVLGTTGLHASENAVTKIGVVDWQTLFSKAPQAEAAAKRLESEFLPIKEKAIAKQKELQTKTEKLQRDREVMSESERSKSEKEIVKIQQDLRHMDEEWRQDYGTRQREEMDDFVNLVREVVNKFAAEEKYDLVMSQEGAVFMAERIDVTDKILQRLSKMKVPAKKSDKDKK